MSNDIKDAVANTAQAVLMAMTSVSNSLSNLLGMLKQDERDVLITRLQGAKSEIDAQLRAYNQANSSMLANTAAMTNEKAPVSASGAKISAGLNASNLDVNSVNAIATEVSKMMQRVPMAIERLPAGVNKEQLEAQIKVVNQQLTSYNNLVKEYKSALTNANRGQEATASTDEKPKTPGMGSSS